MISSISCSQWPLPRVLAGAGASSSLRATAVLSLSPSRREATRPLTGGIGRKCDPVLMEKKNLQKQSLSCGAQRGFLWSYGHE